MALSHDEAVKKLNGLRTEVEGLVSSYNEAYQAGKFEEAMKLSKAIEEKVNEYTSVARDDTFEACKNSSDPMLTAVTMLSFVTIGVKDEQKGFALPLLRLYWKNGKVKAEIGIGRGKTHRDQRYDLKARAEMREVQREVARFNKARW